MGKNKGRLEKQLAISNEERRERDLSTDYTNYTKKKKKEEKESLIQSLKREGKRSSTEF